MLLLVEGSVLKLGDLFVWPHLLEHMPPKDRCAAGATWLAAVA